MKLLASNCVALVKSCSEPAASGQARFVSLSLSGSLFGSFPTNDEGLSSRTLLEGRLYNSSVARGSLLGLGPVRLWDGEMVFGRVSSCSAGGDSLESS